MDIMKYIRACAVCKMYFPPNAWLCPLCWKAVEREYLSSHTVYRTEKKIPHLRLMDWHKDNQRLIELFIQSLKQGGPYFIFKRLGLEMFSRFEPVSLWGKKEEPVFIPSPSRTNTKRDHAFMLAEALNFYFGGKTKSLLKRVPSKEAQKNKSKRERAFLKMELTESPPAKRPLVFVDDALTTGSTARAAFRALGQGENFFVFSLVWRRPAENTG